MTTPGPLMMTAQSRRTPALEKELFFSSLVYCIIFPVRLEEARVHSQTFLPLRALLLGKFPRANVAHIARSGYRTHCVQLLRSVMILFPLRRSRRKRITARPKYNLKPSLSTPQKGPRNKLPGSRRLGRCENSDTPNPMKSRDTTDRAECSGDPTTTIQRGTRRCDGWLNPLPVVPTSQRYSTPCGVFHFRRAPFRLRADDATNRTPDSRAPQIRREILRSETLCGRNAFETESYA